MESKNGQQVLPNKTVALNINFPVPYEHILGVATTPYSADMTGPDNGISGALKKLDP